MFWCHKLLLSKLRWLGNFTFVTTANCFCYRTVTFVSATDQSKRFQIPYYKSNVLRNVPLLRSTLIKRTYSKSLASSLLILVTRGGPWQMKAVQICTRLAPALILSRASAPLNTPPTPIIGISPKKDPKLVEHLFYKITIQY